MGISVAGDFTKHLQNTHHIASDFTIPNSVDDQSTEPTLKTLHRLTDLSASDFADEVARFYNLPRVSLAELMAATSLTDRFSYRFLREMTVFAYQTADGQPRLAMGDPTLEAAIRAAEIVLGKDVGIDVASSDDIEIALSEQIDAGDASEPGSAPHVVADSNDDIESLKDLASGAPVVRAVNDLMEKAAELRASDIHLEPFRTGLVVRMRVDGLLRTVPTPAGALPQAMISRIKILAGLNIAERRLPQDGAARARVGKSEIDIRVATMPTQHGEAAVIRLLPRDRGLLDMSRLGLCSHDEANLGQLLALPHGMIVVTGPTGSGKTTTLATMLSILNKPTRKILTIEDPVEYEIPGINQSQVKPSIGLTFANALRAFVRQDPDVIMIGEIRDAETAHIAIHAALTGHLVLTTLHTETAAAAVPRLLDLGVEHFLLKSTLRAVIAQRLVRMLCDRCKSPHPLHAADLSNDPRYAALGLQVGDVIHEPGGCERCGGTGYRGRQGVFEVLRVTEPIRELITASTDSSTIERAAVQAGMTTMVDDAVSKCLTGRTSAAEVLRVTYIR